MKRWTLSLLLSFILGFSIFSLPVLAATYETDVVIQMQIDQPMMKVNGNQQEIDPGRATCPILTEDRTLVPIRAIIEALGGSVYWDEQTQAVTLDLMGDTIVLTIDSHTAYRNHSAYTLDVSPKIIADRTMLPIRFIAESFHLGVAWDPVEKTVTIIRDTFDEAEYWALMDVLPAYDNNAYVILNDNNPYFADYELIRGSFEYYSPLDDLGRCDVAMASISEDIMPTEERGNISSVTPTGWVNNKYDVVSGGYLYNRCHLIGYQLTGENANERNLITGTRYLNIEGMLPFENLIDDYVEQSDYHVMYRVTPVFQDNNLVAHGVLMEAASVEDGGESFSFCIFCYNVQPYIFIDYATGNNYLAQNEPYSEPVSQESHRVYQTPTGKRYHFDPDCGGKNSYTTTLEQAQSNGLTPCQKCVN